MKWASTAAIVVSIAMLMRALPVGQLQQILSPWIESLGAWGPVVFAALYVVATVCLIPGSLLTLIAGAVFGLWIGFLSVSVGSVAGAGCAFLISRYAARSKVEKFARSNPRFGAIDRAIGEGGWKIVALLRLSPAVPFNLQNYLYGLTEIRFWPYLIASWLAMIPGTFMYVYLGHAAGVVAAGEGERSPSQWAMLAIGLAATVAVTVYITLLAKRKLKERTVEDGGEEPTPVERKPESDAPAAVAPGSKLKLYAYALVAAALLIFAVYAQFRPDAVVNVIKSLVGDGYFQNEVGRLK